MDQTREQYERVLKLHADKLKYKLGLKYRSEDYTIVLSDELLNDMLITGGEQVIVKIQTQRFIDAMKSQPKMRDFNRLLESGLRVIPRLIKTLTHEPVADALEFNPETSKFKKVTAAQIARKYPGHPYEKEIHFSTDIRCTGIHWKSGVVIRKTGRTVEEAKERARTAILDTLTDASVYNRNEDSFVFIEDHNEFISDIVAECKSLNRDEVNKLITVLQKEYCE